MVYKVDLFFNIELDILKLFQGCRMKTLDNVVNVDKEMFLIACDNYFKWKDFNASIKKSGSARGINLPESISEQIVCYTLELRWNKGDKY